jgi:hypothetical protein
METRYLNTTMVKSWAIEKYNQQWGRISKGNFTGKGCRDFRIYNVAYNEGYEMNPQLTVIEAGITSTDTSFYKKDASIAWGSVPVPPAPPLRLEVT